MTTIEKLCTDTDQDLIKYWFEEFKASCYNYIEPILDSVTVDLIKHICDALKHDSHVFIMSVDLLVQYILVQNNRNILIDDQLLVIVCVVFICSKLAGEQSDLKSKHIVELYRKITNEMINESTIKEMEVDIIMTLQYKLPLYSKIDDLKTFLVYYLKHFNLRVDIIELCIQILDLVYIYYRRLFYKLKNVYKENTGEIQAFKNMITHRLYLPCGILTCALELTKLKHFMNVKTVLYEISELCGIHYNHIELLGKYIYNIINTSGNSSSNF